MTACTKIHDPVTDRILQRMDPVTGSEAMSIFSIYQSEIIIGLMVREYAPAFLVKVVAASEDAPHVVICRKSASEEEIFRVFHAMIVDADNRLTGTWIIQEVGGSGRVDYVHDIVNVINAIINNKGLSRIDVREIGTTVKILNPSMIRPAVMAWFDRMDIIGQAKSHIRSDFNFLPDTRYFRARRRAAALAVIEDFPSVVAGGDAQHHLQHRSSWA